LRELGLDAHNVAQEHSGVPKLWLKRCPDLLVYLDASLPVIKTRRDVPWGEERLAAQHERLRDARRCADLYIQTDPLTREQVVATVLDYIGKNKDSLTNHCSKAPYIEEIPKCHDK